MMPQTKNFGKVGRTDVEVTVHWRIPLTDPTAEGNRGLEGYDEDSWQSVRPNVGMAKYAAKQQILKLIKSGVDPQNVSEIELSEREWEETSFHDDKYGYVQDADPVTIRQTWGYWKDDEQDVEYGEWERKERE